ncbi:MAG: helix-turn-helix transcriptional regulator [Dermatophilaceae bacterium]
MPRVPVVPSRQAADAIDVLAGLIRRGRHRRGWTQAQLAERIGVTAKTVRAIESGSAAVALGTVLNAADVTGVRLFDAEGEELHRLRARGRETIGLLKRRVDPRTPEVDDDF